MNSASWNGLESICPVDSCVDKKQPTPEGASAVGVVSPDWAALEQLRRACIVRRAALSDSQPGSLDHLLLKESSPAEGRLLPTPSSFPAGRHPRHIARRGRGPCPRPHRSSLSLSRVAAGFSGATCMGDPAMVVVSTTSSHFARSFVADAAGTVGVRAFADGPGESLALPTAWERTVAGRSYPGSMRAIPPARRTHPWRPQRPGTSGTRTSCN